MSVQSLTLSSRGVSRWLSIQVASRNTGAKLSRCDRTQPLIRSARWTRLSSGHRIIRQTLDTLWRP